jgi:L-rhamnose-H+ transport protein
LIHGSFALPMKHIEKRWKWENIWLIYSVAGLIIVPLLIAWLTVPGLGGVYAGASTQQLALVAAFGFGWGLGSTLFGLGISRVGMALGFAIILGITSSLGSLLPLVIQNPAELFTSRGLTLLGGLAIALCGIICCALAGGQREKDQNPGGVSGEKANFRSGLLICIASGILSPMLNFGFVFGRPIQDAAAAAGARPDLAANAIWVPALAGGFLANAGYALYLLMKNKSWCVYTAEGTPGWFWLGAAAMGLIWYGGMAIYGIGAAMMGPLGGVLGWPVFMSMVIITANIWGALTGEWKGAGPRARRLAWSGILLLVGAIVVISRANG